MSAREVVHLFCGASVLYSLVAVLISCILKTREITQKIILLFTDLLKNEGHLI